jgi:hypothetical protein
MDCLFSKPLTEDELSMLLDDQADNSLKQHIEKCSACAQRLKIARQMELYMKGNLFRFDCPDPQTLGDYHHHLLNASAHKTIEDHLQLCASCRSDLQVLINFLEEDSSVTVNAPPEKLIRPPATYFQVTAEVMPLRKVRGQNKRQLRATVNGVQLLFDLQHSPKGITVEGMLIALNKDEMSLWIGSLVEIRTTNELLSVCYIDDMGTFRCEGIPEGIVHVRITSAKGRSILVSDLEIKM